MRSVRVTAAAQPAPQCVVFLPGALQALEEFLVAGFDAAVRERALPLDLEFVDLEPAHLTDRAALDALASGVLAPARARGCRRVWLGGISLGAFMALDLASMHPLLWDGLCLLAPYLGSRGAIAARTSARDQAASRALPDLAQSEEEHRIWHFIEARALDGRPCFLGFGRDDRYAAAHVLMARALPVESVHIVPGGHDWPTWRRLWELFLDSSYA